MEAKLVRVKSVLNKHKRRDEWFLDDYSVNPYYGCAFSCVYCYVRGTKYGAAAKGGFAVKANAPSVLDKELRSRARRKEYGFIAFSSATEPWMGRVEEEHEVSRKCLEVILKHRFPVHCLTKSPSVLRDLGLLRELEQRAILPPDLRGKVDGVLVTFSLSTLEEGLARIFEPAAPPPGDRLDALQRVKEEGLSAGIAFTPVLPLITDSELEEMARTARELECDYVFFGSLTLAGEAKAAYFKLIEDRFPELLDKYQKLYSRSFHPARWYSDRLYRQALACVRKYGLKFGPLNLKPRSI